MNHRPPTKVLRKLSFSTRMRSSVSAARSGVSHVAPMRDSGESRAAHVRPDDSECVVERFDPLVSKVLADEFQFFLVEQGGLHDDRELAADKRRDLDVDEL